MRLYNFLRYTDSEVVVIPPTVWGLRTNTHLQDLFLGMNRLTPEDAKQLGSLLIANHHIRLLDLRNNRLQVIVIRVKYYQPISCVRYDYD